MTTEQNEGGLRTDPAAGTIKFGLICQLCENNYTEDSWNSFALCPTCKQKLVAAMNMATPKCHADPWDKQPEPQNLYAGLNQMAFAVYEGNAKKGFWDNPRNVGETLMLVVTELAEALEAHRKDKRAPDYHPQVPIDKEEFESKYKDTFEDEIADAVIRLLDLCGGWNINLEWHVNEKVKYNSSRERLHGKQY